ncbi:hypothetical protein [Streptomyces sp. WMMB303]|uniref:hypothetical protein n=1 Tax=Streptomyces sp. WMMB303 TaxID=3034154 RepID=UPI0023ECF7FF|nr:hypothetical protein [Streptomyces sp. WMMB303]MDF4254661.1 hypothetical protein [Streptomyces sp. WMMB303]MDF4254698.1 hypothetical protein [Streptomyces sp. WMMB303]
MDEPVPEAELLYEDDSLTAVPTTWDDIEISETQRVGDTQYTRGVIKGSGQERIWAERDFGQGLRNTEEVTTADDVPPGRINSVWRELTGPDAPTDLDAQIAAQDTAVQREQTDYHHTLAQYEQELAPSAELAERRAAVEQELEADPGHGALQEEHGALERAAAVEQDLVLTQAEADLSDASSAPTSVGESGIDLDGEWDTAQDVDYGDDIDM